MINPAHQRDGHRLVLIQRADIRATARTVRSLGVALTLLGLGAWWYDGYETVGLGAFGLVGALVGVLMALVGIAVLAINRRQVILDSRQRVITGMPTDLRFDAIAAVMLGERGHTVEHTRRRRVVLSVVLLDGLNPAQRHALDARDADTLALDLPAALALIDHDSELSLLRTARLVADEVGCPIIDAASLPVTLITRGEHGPSLRAQRLATGTRPPPRAQPPPA